jgi:replicative superfamily II helicase
VPFKFEKHVGKKAGRALDDPIAIFKSLSRRITHTALRPAQEAALKELHKRTTERDAVLKLPTGTGKSTVGLLYLKWRATEKKRPVVYLCPTKQLVEQALDEAEQLGIQAYHYAANEKQPEPECLSGDAVIVCTYEKLFNAKTTFDRPEVHITPAAIVLDDAHAGVDKIREKFTLRIEDTDTIDGLCKILDAPAKQYAPARWDDLMSGRRGVPSLEIPYWSWREVSAEVRKYLADRADDDKKLMFVWPHLKDVLDWCRCIVSPLGIEIVPSVPPVDRVRAFRETDHRLFMSATLADDSVLVRELGCSVESALRPIAPAGASFGQRLVLVPSLIDRSLDLKWVRAYCAKASKKHSVVVLCSSTHDAKKWEDCGATAVLGDDVAEAVKALRDGTERFVVFANRYDGVDLPDDACRILVLDGLPVGQGIADSHDGSIRGGFQARATHRIEQGMGRAVRSDADYAVVILAGSDLASFAGKPEVREQMSPDARAQIELAYRLPKLVSEDGEAGEPAEVVQSMIKQCLAQESGWRTFYDEQVRSEVSELRTAIEEDRVRLAAAERRAAERAYDGNAPDAVDVLQQATDDYAPREKAKSDGRLARRRAYLMQTIASFMHEFDKGQALQLQDSAHELDRELLRPTSAAKKLRGKPASTDQAAQVLHLYSSFEHANAFIAELDSVRAVLSFESDPSRFEQALKDLAPFLGAHGVRPEEELGEGPDNLFQWPALNLVTEAKNEAEYDAIPKKDAEQLLHSMEWFRAKFPTMKDASVPLLVCRVSKVAKGVLLPKGARVLTPHGLDKLLDATGRFCQALAQKPAAAWSAPGVLKLLKSQGLEQERVLSAFTVEPTAFS